MISINKDIGKVSLSSDAFLLVPSDSLEAFNHHSDHLENYEGENYKTKYQAKHTKVNTLKLSGDFSTKRLRKKF